MTKNITLPRNLDSRLIEHVLRNAGMERGRKPENLKLDLERVQFADPAGMVSLLELLRFFSSLHVPVTLNRPGDDVYSYMDRMGFWKKAGELSGHRVPPSERGKTRGSDVLLEITGINESQDVHRILGAIRDRAKTILYSHLNYPKGELDRFLTALSEVCQNIIEHSGDRGYVAVQKYFYRKTLGKNVVKMVVSDLGKGIRATLGEKLEEEFQDEWTDRTAIEQALFQNQSRYDDPGRGHGLASVHTSTEHWNGLLTLRSGTARVSQVPDWSEAPEAREDLPQFPGTQVVLLLPEKEDRKQKSLF